MQGTLMSAKDFVGAAGRVALRLPVAVLYGTISAILLSFILTIAVCGVFVSTLARDE
jgi:hypothetical protein